MIALDFVVSIIKYYKVWEFSEISTYMIVQA